MKLEHLSYSRCQNREFCPCAILTGYLGPGKTVTLHTYDRILTHEHGKKVAVVIPMSLGKLGLTIPARN